MYVCICHALTDTDVQSAECQGAARPAEVFHHYGVQAQCGRCVNSMRCLLKEPKGLLACAVEAGAHETATSAVS